MTIKLTPQELERMVSGEGQSYEIVCTSCGTVCPDHFRAGPRPQPPGWSYRGNDIICPACAMTDAPTDRLTAFVQAWREIEALRQQADSWNPVRNTSADHAAARHEARNRFYRAEHETAARFGVDASDVRSAGRVIAKLMEGER